MDNKGHTADKFSCDIRNSLLCDLIKATIEDVLECELKELLGYEKHTKANREDGNSRNGFTTKILASKFGKIKLKSPRDRKGIFCPTILGKSQRKLDGLDELILYLFSSRASKLEVAQWLRDLYQNEPSNMLAVVSEAISARIVALQSIDLHSIKSIVFLDRIETRVTLLEASSNIPLYYAIGINHFNKHILLGFWSAASPNPRLFSDMAFEFQQRGLRSLNFMCSSAVTAFTKQHSVGNTAAKVNTMTRVGEPWRMQKFPDDKQTIIDSPTRP